MLNTVKSRAMLLLEKVAPPANRLQLYTKTLIPDKYKE